MYNGLVCMINVMIMTYFLFFKQKTAYEMRISDWSSDVCSSDLLGGIHRPSGARRDRLHLRARAALRDAPTVVLARGVRRGKPLGGAAGPRRQDRKSVV